MEHKVLVNGNRANWNLPLVIRDKVLIELFAEEEENPIPAFIYDVQVLYEDDHVIVFNKPPYMNTHPNDDTDINTLINAAHYYANQKEKTLVCGRYIDLNKDHYRCYPFCKTCIGRCNLR